MDITTSHGTHRAGRHREIIAALESHKGDSHPPGGMSVYEILGFDERSPDALESIRRSLEHLGIRINYPLDKSSIDSMEVTDRCTLDEDSQKVLSDAVKLFVNERDEEHYSKCMLRIERLRSGNNCIYELLGLGNVDKDAESGLIEKSKDELAEYDVDLRSLESLQKTYPDLFKYLNELSTLVNNMRREIEEPATFLEGFRKWRENLAANINTAEQELAEYLIEMRGQQLPDERRCKWERDLQHPMPSIRWLRDLYDNTDFQDEIKTILSDVLKIDLSYLHNSHEVEFELLRRLYSGSQKEALSSNELLEIFNRSLDEVEKKWEQEKAKFQEDGGDAREGGERSLQRARSYLLDQANNRESILQNGANSILSDLMQRANAALSSNDEIEMRRVLGIPENAPLDTTDIDNAEADLHKLIGILQSSSPELFAGKISSVAARLRSKLTQMGQGAVTGQVVDPNVDVDEFLDRMDRNLKGVLDTARSNFAGYSGWAPIGKTMLTLAAIGIAADMVLGGAMSSFMASQTGSHIIQALSHFKWIIAFMFLPFIQRLTADMAISADNNWRVMKRLFYARALSDPMLEMSKRIPTLSTPEGRQAMLDVYKTVIFRLIKFGRLREMPVTITKQGAQGGPDVELLDYNWEDIVVDALRKIDHAFPMSGNRPVNKSIDSVALRNELFGSATNPEGGELARLGAALQGDEFVVNTRHLITWPWDRWFARRDGPGHLGVRLNTFISSYSSISLECERIATEGSPLHAQQVLTNARGELDEWARLFTEDAETPALLGTGVISMTARLQHPWLHTATWAYINFNWLVSWPFRILFGQEK